MIESKLIELVSSSVLKCENNRNPFPLAKQAMKRYLQMATIKQSVDRIIKQRGEQLEKQGIKAIDALHVACAEALDSDYFLTCDKRLINRCQILDIKTLNPIDFIMEQEI